MSEDVIGGDNVLHSSKNKSVATKETWLKIQADYEVHNYISLKELASRYGVDDGALESRVSRGKWYERQRALRNKVLEKAGQVVENKAKSYLERVYRRVENYERKLDLSQEFNGSKAPDGTPLLDPEALNTYTQTEARIFEMGRKALGIVDQKVVDLTSGGLSMAQNLASAIEALRAQNLPALTDEQVNQAISIGIEQKTDES